MRPAYPATMNSRSTPKPPPPPKFNTLALPQQMAPEELTDLGDEDMEVWALGGTKILPKPSSPPPAVAPKSEPRAKVAKPASVPPPAAPPKSVPPPTVVAPPAPLPPDAFASTESAAAPPAESAALPSFPPPPEEAPLPPLSIPPAPAVPGAYSQTWQSPVHAQPSLAPVAMGGSSYPQQQQYPQVAPRSGKTHWGVWLAAAGAIGLFGLMLLGGVGYFAVQRFQERSLEAAQNAQRAKDESTSVAAAAAPTTDPTTNQFTTPTVTTATGVAAPTWAAPTYVAPKIDSDTSGSRGLTATTPSTKTGSTAATTASTAATTTNSTPTTKKTDDGSASGGGLGALFGSDTGSSGGGARTTSKPASPKGDGVLQTFAAGKGKPVFVDGQRVGTGGTQITTACGRHSVAVGTGKAKSVDIPCNGSPVTVGSPDGT